MNQAIFITVFCLFFGVRAQDDADKKITDIFGTSKLPVIEKHRDPPVNNEQKCQCVSYYLCNGNSRTERPRDIKGANDCPSYLEVCCNPPNIIRPIDPPVRTPDDIIADIFGTSKLPVIETHEDPLVNNEQKCQCVLYYLCNNNSRTEGLIDIARADDCPNYLEVCCNPPNIITQTNLRPLRSVHKDCGYRNPDGVGFRVTGYSSSEAQFGEFPWMVAILTEEFNANTDSNLNFYECGGALIHPQVVLTAAHCVPDAKQKKYKVRAGEWDTQTTTEIYPHQDRYVSSVVIHNKYNASWFFNDVALLFLDSSLNITDNVNCLCLPPQDIVIPSGTKCYTSGWGKNAFGKGGVAEVIPKKIDLPIVDRNICQNQLRSTRLGNSFELDKSFVCAGGEEGKDTCRGDSGSALACPIQGQKNRFQHVGIVARGIGCGENQIPNVYVNIPMFRNWIDQQLTDKNLELSYYQY